MTVPIAYADMKAFLRFFAERYLDRRIAAPAERPLAALERQEREAPDRAPSALRMAVNDCLEMSAAWPLAQVAALDEELQGHGLPSLSTVRTRAWGRYAAMLKRARLRSADELFVAQAVLADASLAQSLPVDERTALLGMVRQYRPDAPPARRPGAAPPRAARGPAPPRRRSSR